MGRYLSWPDLAARYPHVERLGAGASDVDSQYIAPAEAELEGRLGAIYTVPFSSNNLTAKDIAADLAYIRMNLIDGESRSKLISAINARLKRLANGDEVMILADGTIMQAGSEVAWSNTQDYHPVFDLDRVENWAVDSERIQDVEDDRGIYGGW